MIYLILFSLSIAGISLYFLCREDDSKVISKDVDFTSVTQYRTICRNGYTTYLQYLSPRGKWLYVFRPYYDTFRGREDEFGLINCDLYLSEYNVNLSQFPVKYPNINVYLREAAADQLKLKEKAENYIKNLNQKKGVIKYL